VNGVALGLVLWLGLALAGDALTTRFPFLWPVSPFLHPPCMGCPEAASLAALAQYGVNRVCVALLGVSLFALGARRLQDSQAVLGIGNPRRLETARFETGEKETGRKPTGIPSEPRSL